MLETDYVSKPKFIENFWGDFRAILRPELRKKVCVSLCVCVCACARFFDFEEKKEGGKYHAQWRCDQWRARIHEFIHT